MFIFYCYLLKRGKRGRGGIDKEEFEEKIKGY